MGGDENGSSEETAGSCAVRDFIAGKQKALLCALTMGVLDALLEPPALVLPNDAFGGLGRDFINVDDGDGNDVVNCGGGKDKVVFDKGDEIAKNCERRDRQ